MTPLEYALDLARARTPVIPCSTLETLLAPLEDASIDASTIEKWWQRSPTAIPATPTGRVSGLVVIAVDAEHLPRDSRTWYEEHLRALSTTRTCHTLRGGIDYWFSLPDNVPGCGASTLEGISVYGDSSYAIHWPAVGLPHEGTVQPLPAEFHAWLEPHPAPQVAAATITPQAIATTHSDEQQPDDRSGSLTDAEPANSSPRHQSSPPLEDHIADKTLRALRAAGSAGLTRTQIRDLFKRNESAHSIGTALESLARRGLAEPHQQRSNGGRPAEIWRSADYDKTTETTKGRED
jgi:hypothetical protein